MKKINLLLLAVTCSMQLLAQGTFQLSTGTVAKPTGAVYVVFDNMSLVNNGTLQQAAGDGTIKFAGAGDDSISGSGSTTIDSLLLAKASTANLTLQSNINIVSQLNFDSGMLNLDNSIIDLGSNAVLTNESETSRAYSLGTGYIQSTQTLNAPSSLNAGNLGAIITSSANMGSTVVRRGFTSNGSIPGNASILRYYVITPTNNTGLNATFRFAYLDAELNGLGASTLDLWKSQDNITWVDSGYTTRAPVNNYVEKTGINDFSFWTLAPQFSVVPIVLSTFNAYKDGSGIEVTWKVTRSINLSKYEIERSANGVDFIIIGTLSATGAANYIYPDRNPFDGNNFYRLRMVDADGSVSYSAIIKVNINSNTGQAGFYPNPVVANIVALQLTNVIKGTYRLQLFNNYGQQVYSAVITHNGGSANQMIYLPKRISSGIYHLRLRSNSVVLYNGSLLVK
ncbi:MAG: T9SS type A sorting domain-containing protein [Ginsengibacter sp.]